MDGSKRTGVWQAEPETLGPVEEKLDRALVVGLLLEVVLETAGSPLDPNNRRQLVKTRLQDTLVTHLAGRITLDRFHHLLRKLDDWFPLYYPLTTGGSPQGPAPAPVSGASAPPNPPSAALLRCDRLQAWLNDRGRDLLPRRPHRKLTVDKLREFLMGTGGAWFRIKDFEQHFGVDRKTAWEYLQKLLQAGLLRHNQRRSAAVRYALATRFLAIRVDVLGPRVAEALGDLPPNLAAQVRDWLAATDGEAFREEDWPDRLEPGRGQPILSRLRSAGVLEEVAQAGEGRLLRVAPRCRRDE